MSCASIGCTLYSTMLSLYFFFQAEDGIRDLVRSRGLGDVYKRQLLVAVLLFFVLAGNSLFWKALLADSSLADAASWGCLLYTSDAADDLPCVDLGGRRTIKKKKNKLNS